MTALTDLAGVLGPAALPVKAVHIIFVIYWMAGLLIAGRYLVHMEGEQAISNTAAFRARWMPRVAKLRRIILVPSLVISWTLGLLLAANLGFAGGWLHIKIAIVLGLTLYQFWATRAAHALLAGHTPASGRTLRLMNELPSLAIIAIVLLVVLRPF